MTYVVKHKQIGLRTSLVYVKHIITGLRDNNVPDEYIDYVKTRVIANNPGLEMDIKEL
jgi:hypothetical protein